MSRSVKWKQRFDSPSPARQEAPKSQLRKSPSGFPQRQRAEPRRSEEKGHPVLIFLLLRPCLRQLKASWIIVGKCRGIFSGVILFSEVTLFFSSYTFLVLVLLISVLHFTPPRSHCQFKTLFSKIYLSFSPKKSCFHEEHLSRR